MYDTLMAVTIQHFMANLSTEKPIILNRNNDKPLFNNEGKIMNKSVQQSISDYTNVNSMIDLEKKNTWNNYDDTLKKGAELNNIEKSERNATTSYNSENTIYPNYGTYLNKTGFNNFNKSSFAHLDITKRNVADSNPRDVRRSSGSDGKLSRPSSAPRGSTRYLTLLRKTQPHRNMETTAPLPPKSDVTTIDVQPAHILEGGSKKEKNNTQIKISRNQFDSNDFTKAPRIYINDFTSNIQRVLLTNAINNRNKYTPNRKNTEQDILDGEKIQGNEQFPRELSTLFSTTKSIDKITDSYTFMDTYQGVTTFPSKVELSTKDSIFPEEVRPLSADNSSEDASDSHFFIWNLTRVARPEESSKEEVLVVSSQPEDVGLVLTPIGVMDSHRASLVLYIMLLVSILLLFGLVTMAGYWIKAKLQIRRLDREMRKACIQGLDHRFAEQDL